jgi:hypothetical protein
MRKELYASRRFRRTSALGHRVVTINWPLRSVKLLMRQGDKLVVRRPEKAGVGGSTPSLATIIRKHLVQLPCAHPSPLSVRTHEAPRNTVSATGRAEELRPVQFFLGPLSVRFGRPRGSESL